MNAGLVKVNHGKTLAPSRRNLTPPPRGQLMAGSYCSVNYFYKVLLKLLAHCYMLPLANTSVSECMEKEKEEEVQEARGVTFRVLGT